MTSAQKKTIALAVAVGLMASVMAYFLAISPMLEVRSLNNEEAANAEQRTVMLRNQIARLRVQESQLDETRTAVASLTRQFPDSFNEDKWLKTLNNLASSAGVVVDSSDVGLPVDVALANLGGGGAIPGQVVPQVVVAPTPAQGAVPGAVPGTVVSEFPVAESAVKLTLSGPLNNIVKFVAALEEAERPLVVTKVTINGQTTGVTTASAVLDGKLVITRPLQDPAPTPEPGTATETPTPEATETETVAP